MRFILEQVVDAVAEDDETASRTTFLQGCCLIGLSSFLPERIPLLFTLNKILITIMQEQNRGQSSPEQLQNLETMLFITSSNLALSYRAESASILKPTKSFPGSISKNQNLQ